MFAPLNVASAVPSSGLKPQMTPRCQAHGPGARRDCQQEEKHEMYEVFFYCVAPRNVGATISRKTRFGSGTYFMGYTFILKLIVKPRWNDAYGCLRLIINLRHSGKNNTPVGVLKGGRGILGGAPGATTTELLRKFCK